MRITRHATAGRGEPVALTIGNFDGVHLGHQAMIARLKRMAGRLGVASCIMTFEPHPRECLMPEQAPARLTDLREKLELLAGYGVNRVQICRFNRKFANISAEQFVTRILQQEMNVQWLLIGEDFRFGARRSGDLALLQKFFPESGQLEIMPPVMLDGLRVSSTAVRNALVSGNLDLAADLLGRPYSLSGRVVDGMKLAKKLGFPTANIQLKHHLLPLSGIFVVEASWCNDSGHTQRIRGVASLGIRPTVLENAQPLLEVHLFDFDEQIYGQQLRIDFLQKLREEEKFPDMETLVTQIEQDIDCAKTYFSRMDAAMHQTVCLDC
ncbi:bifunctional riboflavin kinase/FAD synthetase [Betaproteobacteria bacterium PRO4]|uniref:bifunctional riboflavin kinase/FAD synthetase n=1 Tax=Nitrosomonas sp. TaxID=42353 RepID=UPI00256B8AD4|nr:bifunctional riboflavin kinase/FAD synthetase [Nitrosomonas sp.]MDL1866506.1 bifunctional riboflavin kinase/FAD synthetase [Betaproteobacteria bacterium PRO4]